MILVEDPHIKVAIPEAMRELLSGLHYYIVDEQPVAETDQIFAVLGESGVG